MKTPRPLHVVLAVIASVSLLIYVLACTTSFSPDDRQVLYPTFDPPSGALGVALYDRESGRSETLYAASKMAVATNQHPLLMRAEWLPDGRHILVAQASKESGLSLSVLPRGVSEPVRHLNGAAWKEALVALELPFAMVGTQIFLNDEHQFGRLDWRTGATQFNTNGIIALPGGDGKTLVGWRELSDQAAGEFGVIDPETLAFQPQATLTNQLGEGVFPVYRPREHEILFITSQSTNQELQIVCAGRKTFSRLLLRPGCEVKVFGLSLDVGPQNDRVFAAYASQAANQTNSECGLLEIPLNDQPLVFTPLFHLPSVRDQEMLLAQPSLSHDGKTWAIATTLLYQQSKEFAPEDCALFLVDVTQPTRPVTKVPIAVPAKREQLL